MQESFLYVKSNDTFLFVRTVGSGSPLLIIHGGPGLNHHYLLPYMDQLSNQHQLIYFDQRYCGESEGNLDRGKISLHQLVQDIEQIRKALGHEKMAILGHSFGAHLAILYALEYPQHVSRIMSISGLSLSWVGIGLFVKEFLKRTKLMKIHLEEIRSSKEYLEGNPATHRAFYKLIFSTYCHDPNSTEKIQVAFTTESAKNGIIVSHYLREELLTNQFDLTDAFNQLHIPILILHGVSDPYPADKARAAAELLNSGYYVELEECGHFPFMEQNQKFVETVNKFIGGRFSSLKASDRAAPEDFR